MNKQGNDTLMIIRLAEEINGLCKEYNEKFVLEKNTDGRKQLMNMLVQKCQCAYQNISIKYPALLLALMDAYEITRDEEMLQGVLDVVSGNLERLEVSAENVKLLSYCWYYVEEEECAERARQMLEELKERGEQAEVAEAAKVYEDMVGE